MNRRRKFINQNYKTVFINKKIYKILFSFIFFNLFFYFIAQKRYKEHNTQLNIQLEKTYDFLNVNIDPIMTKAIEKLLINKPENVADFLANYMRGTIVISDYEKSVNNSIFISIYFKFI